MTVTGDKYRLGQSGKRPYDVFQNTLSDITTALQEMKDGELNAIEQFLTHMAFESATDAQPDVLGATFKAVGKELWETALEAVPSVAGIGLADKAWGVAEAVLDEMERATKAQTEVKVASFITALRSRTASKFRTVILGLPTADDLDGHFETLQGGWDQPTKTVIGEKAVYLRNLDEVAKKIKKVVPQPIEYEERLISRWVKDRRAGGASKGFQPTGVIQLKYETDHADGVYSYELQSAEVMTAHHSGNAADMLTRVMKETGKRIYDLGIPVQVLLRTENVNWGGRSYYVFWVYSAQNFQRDHWWKPAHRAWVAMPWEPIDNVRELAGVNDA